MDIFAQLRKKFDGADSFVSGGHSIGGEAGTLHADRIRNTPEWVNDDAQVRSLIQNVFPKWTVNEVQLKRASRWTAVIHMYFRMGWTSGEVGLELGVPDGHVRVIVNRIRKAYEGRRTDTGKPKTRKLGRPRKVL